jgi:tRNA 2-thiocytidine biosynthesis protein TtcA
MEKLSAFCKLLDIPLHYRTTEPDLEKGPSKSACFICSWHRRKVLFELTSELNFNKLALGHHRNDANETLLMNMIYHGTISSLPYSIEVLHGQGLFNIFKSMDKISEEYLPQQKKT